MVINKKRVMFVLPDLSGGGAERVTLDLINNISKEKFDVILFLLRKHGEYLNELPENIIIEYGITGPQSIVKNYFRIMKKMNKCVNNVDLVIGSLELKGHLFSTIAAKKAKKPIIGWLHKHLGYYLDSLPFIKKIIYKMVTRHLFNRMDKIVTVSEDAKDSVIKLFPKVESKVSYIYNPIDVSKIEMLSKKEVPKWFNQIKSKPIILSVGRLEYQKGFDILINSFAKLVRMGYEGTLVILGEGSLRNELSKLISDLNIQNRVLLPGFTNPYPIMRNCDVFILSSRYEGLPTVLIEALALGQRVISTDCPSGPREILKEGKFGKLVKSESIDALTKEIKNFFELNKNYQTSSISNKDHEINKVHDFEKKNVCEKWEFLITNTLI